MTQSRTPEIITVTILWVILASCILFMCVRQSLRILQHRMRLNWAISAISSSTLLGQDTEDYVDGHNLMTRTRSSSGSISSLYENRLANSDHRSQQDDRRRVPLNSEPATLWGKGLTFTQILMCAAISTYNGPFANGSPLRSTPSSVSDDVVSDDEDTRAPICSVCLDDIRKQQNVCILSCSHIFHANCLHNWLRTANRCPYCNRVAFATIEPPTVAPSEGEMFRREDIQEDSRALETTTFTTTPLAQMNGTQGNSAPEPSTNGDDTDWGATKNV